MTAGHAAEDKASDGVGVGAAEVVRAMDVGDSNAPSLSFRLQGYKEADSTKVNLPSSCRSKVMLGLPLAAISKSATPVGIHSTKGEWLVIPPLNLFLTSSHSWQVEDWAPPDSISPAPILP